MADSRRLPLTERSRTLNPNEDFNPSWEKRREEEARLAVRANLKRQYQLQLNNPYRTERIDDPAISQWVYAKTNVYPNFRATPKTSLLGFMFSVVPVFGFYYLFKWSREQMEEQIKAGTYKPRFSTVE
ncbi:NADH dehydrogenase [ubiquinone] 1 beta subcomplex subunit 4 [Nematolebias whitei]|uniref:NADH dehydrogenase [ubiquinone] 1 beta subcomplex subunit 4 n=1 Tax=Nematolebias whitei TaxID=451745 RepID=UPI00189A5A5C|nr:NADH dehydrogenase [ubiquinone] 1 beta subcomplex subunit 4 [Nematolebias whitei]